MTSPKTMVPQLFESSGLHAGRVHELPYGLHVLGRGTEATIQLDHEDVSRRHAELDVGPEGVIVRDLGSKNGVRVDTERVEGTRRVAHGQTISLGELALVLSHPASQVTHALARAGETTMTATATADDSPPGSSGLLLPLAGVLVFGGLVAAMLLL
ncbi:MAG: FHA domain-containing protein [Deltaproteobacteria bacterium]|nr:FHA domain-containing protein [Nannocystaceae bacterium]